MQEVIEIFKSETGLTCIKVPREEAKYHTSVWLVEESSLSPENFKLCAVNFGVFISLIELGIPTS